MVDDEELLAPYVPRLLLGWPTDASRVRLVDGTVASVDLSGFTRLTERLAATGRGGAEELAAVISRIFTGLSDLAFAGGGDILKFGGDALLILFDGDGHARRAVGAVAAMQRLIRTEGRVETGLGAVRLQMSAGAHSGRFPLYLTGAGYRVLHVVGRDASRVVALESAASAGQVLVSDATAAVLPGSWTTEAEPGAHLVRLGTAQPLEGAAPPVPRSLPGIEIPRYLPPPLLAALREPGIDGEHRSAAIAFMCTPGTDALEAAGGTKAVQARLDAITEAVDDAVDRYGITWLETDVAVDAAKFILVAGAPTASEDDEQRLLRAVRDIADSCGDHLQIGVNRGPVFMGRVGHPQRRSYSLLGDAMNLSARLMARARPGQAIVSRSVLDLSRARFLAEPLDPFLVKGKRLPVEAAVLGTLLDEGHGDADRVVLVGREAELDLLGAAARAVATGRGGVIEVVADAGMGKSRLIGEFARSVPPGVRWIAGAASPYTASAPYAAVRSMVRTVLGIDRGASTVDAGDALVRWLEATAPDLHPWAPLLADVAAAEVAPTSEVERLDPTLLLARRHEVVASALARALDGPTVLLVEDLHWADDASLELLARIAAASDASPWLVLGTRRGDAEPALLGDAAKVLALDALEARDAERLAVYVADELPLPDHLLEAIARRSGGNPLFVRELVAGLATRAAAGVALDEEPDDLPTSIEGLIRSRIDTLSVPDRALLRDASVIGPEVDLDLLGLVRDDPTAVDPQRWRPMAPFASVDGRTLRFTHDLFRTGAYEGLSYRRRRLLHARVADALVATSADLDDLAPVLALHYASADRHDDAWRWAVRSGQRAWATGAVAEAAEQFQVALRAAPHVQDPSAVDASPGGVAEVAEVLGDACDRLGRFPQATAAYRHARRCQGDPVRQVKLLRKQGTIEEHAGRYSSSLRWFGRGLGQLERLLAEPPDGLDERAAAVARVDLELAYGVTRFYQGRLREAARWCEKAASGAEAIDEVALQAQAHLQLEMVYSDLGHPDRARHGEAALALFTELGDHLKLGHLHLNLGVSAYNEGRWDEALRCYGRSAEAYGRAGDVVGAASTHNNTAEILTDQGRYEEARAELEVARRGYRAAGYAWGTALTTSGLSRLAVRAGDFSTAHALLDAAEREFATLDSAALVLDTRVRQVECLVAERRGTEALALADLVTAELAAFGTVPLLPAALARLRGWALVLDGRPVEGRASMEQARRLAMDEDATFEALLATAALVQLDRAEGRSPLPTDEQVVVEGCDRLGIVQLPPPPA